MEIIEIGAVMVNGQTYRIDSEYQEFVKPVRHPKLTDFCLKLTHICQKDVDQANEFPKVISEFKAWMDAYPVIEFCSWGDYDKKQIKQDSLFHNVPYPITAPHRNLKKAFSEYMRTSKRFGMAGALQKIGLKLHGTHHRGIDDARNIAAIFRYMSTN